MPVEQDRLSRVYRYWKVRDAAGAALASDYLTGATARVAFTVNASTRPDTADWTAATLVYENADWWVRLLVGPGGEKVLAYQAEPYQEWVEVDDNPELIVFKPGTTVIT